MCAAAWGPYAGKRLASGNNYHWDCERRHTLRETETKLGERRGLTTFPRPDFEDDMTKLFAEEFSGKDDGIWSPKGQ